MTPYQLDANVLVRLADPTDPDRPVAAQALAQLGHVVRSAPQNYTEFRAVATRPKGRPSNGLGQSVAETERLAVGFELQFPLLPDTPDVHPEWKRVVAVTGTIGKQVHDARPAAVCFVHRITHLLTFNTAHFTRFAAVPPGLGIVHPATV